jgi:hypothetical protein
MVKAPENANPPPIGPYPSGQGAISGFFDQPVPRHEFIDAIDLVIWETPNRATEAHKARICDLAKDHAEAALEALVSIARNGASEAAIAFPHDWPVWG